MKDNNIILENMVDISNILNDNKFLDNNTLKNILSRFKSIIKSNYTKYGYINTLSKQINDIYTKINQLLESDKFNNNLDKSVVIKYSRPVLFDKKEKIFYNIGVSNEILSYRYYKNTIHNAILKMNNMSKENLDIYAKQYGTTIKKDMEELFGYPKRFIISTQYDTNSVVEDSIVNQIENINLVANNMIKKMHGVIPYINQFQVNVQLIEKSYQSEINLANNDSIKEWCSSIHKFILKILNDLVEFHFLEYEAMKKCLIELHEELTNVYDKLSN